jgi:hypothetical protein
LHFQQHGQLLLPCDGLPRYLVQLFSSLFSLDSTPFVKVSQLMCHDD